MFSGHVKFLLSLLPFFFFEITAPLGWFGIACILFTILKLYISYQKSSYQNISDASFWKVYSDVGVYGEFLTVRAIEKISPEEKIFVNVYLPKKKEETETTEIDVLYLNAAGIFVLESKNYSGWIFGDEKNKHWTQSLNQRTKNKFFNPIWQNKAHIEALKNLLGEKEEEIFQNIIVFSERCSLKKISLKSKDVNVIKRNELRRTIKSLSKSVKLSQEDIEQIEKKVTPYLHADERTKEEHINKIKEKQATVLKEIKTEENTEIKVEEKTEVKAKTESDIKLEVITDNPICPGCGSQMVKRKTSRGENKGKEFWGCESYPKCRKMIPIE